MRCILSFTSFFLQLPYVLIVAVSIGTLGGITHKDVYGITLTRTRIFLYCIGSMYSLNFVQIIIQDFIIFFFPCNLFAEYSLAQLPVSLFVEGFTLQYFSTKLR